MKTNDERLTKAPVILSARRDEDLVPLLDFVDLLGTHDNVLIAEAESRRLAPYFYAMTAFISRAAGQIAERKQDVPDAETIGKLSTPENLTAIFNGMAAFTRATILSDVAIVPMNIGEAPAVGHLFNKGAFKASYTCAEHDFYFGFMKVDERVSGLFKKAHYSTTFPVMYIDQRMLDSIAPHQPEPLISALQNIMSFVNHDMLHHFTSTYVNDRTVGKYGRSAEDVMDWSYSLTPSSHGETYENWAQMSHERILLESSDNPDHTSILQAVDGYFNELERIGKNIRSSPAANEEKTGAHQEMARKTTVFYGLFLAHLLTRVFPLTHPVLNHCLERLEHADPNPELALQDLTEQIFPEKKIQEEKRWSRIRARVTESDKTSTIIEGYKNSGIVLAPEMPEDLTYARIRMLQLVHMGPKDMLSHVPHPAEEDDDTRNARAATGEELIRMILATAKTVGIYPRTPAELGQMLIAAIENTKSEDEIITLIKQGADLNKKTSYYNETALMTAVRENKKNIAALLIENGADIRLKNRDGHTAYDLAKKFGHKMLCTLLEMAAEEEQQKKAGPEGSPPPGPQTLKRNQLKG